MFKGSKNPDAAWEFVKYLASPAAQTKIMELKASLPANKEVLAGPFSTSFPGADVLAAAIAYAHLKPSFKGYNDWTTALQTEIDANVFIDAKKTAKQAITDVMPQLDEILAASDGRDRRRGGGMTASAAPRRRGEAGRSAANGAGRSSSSRRPCSAWPCCRPGRSWPPSRSA